MSIDFSLKEALLSDAYDLHYSITLVPPWEEDKLVDLDTKIQHFIKEYQAINPLRAEDLSKEYNNANISQLIKDYKKRLLGREFGVFALHDTIESSLKAFERNVLSNLSKDMPDVDLSQRLSRDDRFVTTVSHNVSTGNLAPLEEILKEGPIDINAKSVVNIALAHPPSKHSNKMLEFLLNHGATISAENIPSLISYFSNQEQIKVPLDFQLLELMIQKGLDVNAKNPIGQSLLGVFLFDDDTRNHLVFLGAGGNQDQALFKRARPYPTFFELNELIAIRESVLQEMQKPKDFPISQFTPAQREQFVKRCYEKKLFCEKYQGIQPAIINQMERHDQFIEACVKGDLDAAAELLKQGHIDINVCMLPRKFPKDPSDFSDYYPLLNHACLTGDVKLVEFLIKAGVNVNAAYSGGVREKYQFHRWLPAIIETTLFGKENKPQIIGLLSRAGADINLQDRSGELWFDPIKLYPFFYLSNPDCVNVLYFFLLQGIDISVIQPMFGQILKCIEGEGWDPAWNLGEDGQPHLVDPFTRNDREKVRLTLLGALVFYGVDVNPKELSEEHDFLKIALEIRNAALAEMLKTELRDAPDLKKFSMDPISIIAGYATSDEIVKALNPKQRVELFRKCQSKLASRAGSQ